MACPGKTVSPDFTWKINNPEAIRETMLAANPQVGLAEAYVRGDFDLVGDLTGAFPLADYLIHKDWNIVEKAHLLKLMSMLTFAKRSHPASVPVRLTGALDSRSRDGEERPQASLPRLRPDPSGSQWILRCSNALVPGAPRSDETQQHDCIRESQVCTVQASRSLCFLDISSNFTIERLRCHWNWDLPVEDLMTVRLIAI